MENKTEIIPLPNGGQFIKLEGPGPNLIKALIKAQSEMEAAKKDSKNPHFKSNYADINSIREAILPTLNKNGLLVLQPIVNTETGYVIKTQIIHESGEKIECETPIFGQDGNAQHFAAGVTYARRIAIQSLVFVGAEDDDGNTVANTGKHQSIIQQGVKIQNKIIAENADTVKVKSPDLQKYFKVLIDTQVATKEEIRDFVKQIGNESVILELLENNQWEWDKVKLPYLPKTGFNSGGEK